VTRTITIDRVVMSNAALRPQDADAFRGAVSAELARLVDAGGTPSDARSADSIAVPLTGSGDLAGDVAAAIYGALGKAG
jgi:hypothetical protein